MGKFKVSNHKERKKSSQQEQEQRETVFCNEQAPSDDESVDINDNVHVSVPSNSQIDIESKKWFSRLCRSINCRSHRYKWRCRIFIIIIIVLLLLVTYFCVDFRDTKKSLPQLAVRVPPLDKTVLGKSVMEGYLVWSPSCHMPSIDPLAADVMNIFKQVEYEPCSRKVPMTRIEMNWTTSEATLIYDYRSSWYSSIKKPTCCYSEIFRAGSGKKADEEFKLSECQPFKKSFKLPATVEFIYVQCKLFGFINIYKNTHAIVREKPSIRSRLNEFKKKSKSHRPLSVLMLSIDSISRLNLLRAMPKTAQHLYDNMWFELQGYNKIDDNTFPNLMAILTGYNYTLYERECKPSEIGMLEKCPFIWKDFKDMGYVTAYGEDEATMSSFTVQKPGFFQPPTDYYLRPYIIAAEEMLPTVEKHQLTLCLGFNHSVEHIYDYAMDYALHYKSDPSFGLFWTNSFSHNDISDPSLMDEKIRTYLKTLELRGILNDSMVVFLSDHGMRFGPVRQLFTGWHEERLPFLFIWLPQWFRDEHPEIVQALKINRNRLTNPYDLYMTLEHVLRLSTPRYRDFSQAKACPKCQSMFTEIPWNRSCADASIAPHWCTCYSYSIADTNDPIVKKAAQFVIDDINHGYENFRNGGRTCAKLVVKQIMEVRKAGNERYDDYLLKFEVSPSNGWFEATVRHQINNGDFTISGSVSRLNRYGTQSDCMTIDYLKKYCYCI